MLYMSASIQSQLEDAGQVSGVTSSRKTSLSSPCSPLRNCHHPLFSPRIFDEKAETGDYGGAYFGDGLPNTDLQFML